MASPDYVIRTMAREELRIAVDWAATEGWNPGLHDSASFYAADPEGFLVGELDGEPIATISVVRYGIRFGFLGFYIVKPACRGRGYGLKIWNAGLERLTARTVGLDGVPAQQANYRKSGFKLAYRNIRYEGTTGGSPTAADAIIDLSAVPFDDVAQYDRPCFSEPRGRFLQAWVGQPESIGLGIMRAGALVGYGVIRPCRKGFKVGPLFADTPEVADTLFVALKSRVRAEEPIYLDTPEANPEAVALAGRHGMQPCFETARMYRGPVPEVPLARIFGVTTFELG